MRRPSDADIERLALERGGRRELMGEYGRTQPSDRVVELPKRVETGWRPGCACLLACDCGSADVAGTLVGPHGEYCAAGRVPATVPAVVLDPFAGSGTTLAVADGLGRHGIGLEVNPESAADIRHRLERPAAPPRRRVEARPKARGPSLFPMEE